MQSNCLDSPHGSSQVGMADVKAHSSHSPSPISGTPERSSSHTPFKLQANAITLLNNVLHLQEEMNDTIVHLLTLKASVDAHWQKLISEMEITHHQNESKTSEVIKEIKAHYAAALGNAEATHVAVINEAEATYSATTREAILATAVRKAEAVSAMQTSNYNRTIRKPCRPWRMRPSRRKSVLTNPSCRPVEQPFRPVLMRL